jgi:hypothetical protein
VPGLDLHQGAHEGVWVPPPGADPDIAAPSSSPLDDIKTGIKAWFDVGIQLGESVDKLHTTTRKLLARLEHNTPVDYGSGAAGVYPATGSMVLNFGTPDQGSRWEVTNVVIGGLDQNTTAAGTAGLYVSSIGIDSGSAGPVPGGMTVMVDQAKTLPNVAFYGTRQLVVNDQEYLLACIFGGTPGQTYAAQASMTVFPLGAAGGRDTNIL